MHKAIVVGAISLTALGLIPSTTVYKAQAEEELPIRTTAVVTAYTSSPDETDDTPSLTASGTQTHEGTLACPSDLKFGTKVAIAGKVYTCEDRMNARFRDKQVFDIWVQSKSKAYEWGRQVLEVNIYANS